MQSGTVVAALGLLAMACADPVHESAVEVLGPEAPGVPKGPDHRPGQPCLTCHGGEGPSDLVMVFAGTVYAHLSGNDPVSGAIVRIVDANQQTYEMPTNAAGNFWVPERRFQPVFPVNAAVTSGRYSRVMRTVMRLDGSCNGCHTPTENSGSPGHVWVLPDTENPM